MLKIQKIVYNLIFVINNTNRTFIFPSLAVRGLLYVALLSYPEIGLHKSVKMYKLFLGRDKLNP